MRDYLSNDRKLVFDPNESDSVPAWDDRSTDNQKKCLALYRQIAARSNKVWVISKSIGWNPILGAYETAHFPVFSTSSADAWDFMHFSPEVKQWGIGSRSMSIETINFKKPTLTQPRVRKISL